LSSVFAPIERPHQPHRPPASTAPINRTYPQLYINLLNFFIMKKLFIMLSLVGAMMLSFTACENNGGEENVASFNFDKLDPGKTYCFEFTAKVTYMGYTESSSDVYHAMTPEEGKAAASAFESAQGAGSVAGMKISVSVKVLGEHDCPEE
jgi:hypothetical protein